MDVRREDHPTETPVVPPPNLEGAAAVALSGEDRLRNLIRFRDSVRVELHRQLDDMLALPGKQTGGLGGTMLDDITIDAMTGMGLQVSIQTRHPQEEGRAVEDLSVTEAATNGTKPLIQVVR